MKSRDWRCYDFLIKWQKTVIEWWVRNETEKISEREYIQKQGLNENVVLIVRCIIWRMMTDMIWKLGDDEVGVVQYTL